MFQENNIQEPLRVALYIRVSTDEQVEKYGIDLQKESLLGLIKSKGALSNGKSAWIIAGDKYIYIDEGMSGASNINERPAFARLKEDIVMAPIDNKPFDIVAVYKIDRFARSLKILLDIIDLFENNNIKFVSANENIDTSTPFGKAILGIIGIIAELELETIKLRTKDGREQAVKSGVAMGAAAPYGYRKDKDKRLKILKDEADVVKKIFYLFIQEKFSPYKICQFLQENQTLLPEESSIKHSKRRGVARNIKTHSFFWRPEQIRLMLQNEVYIGKYYYGKSRSRKRLDKSEWQLSNYQVPIIIDEITFNKAQRLLKETRFIKNIEPDKHLYLLSGLLKCESCYDPQNDHSRIAWTGDRKETKKGNKKFSYFYRCSRKTKGKYTKACSTIPLPAEQIENYVVNFICALLKNPINTFDYQQKLKSTKTEINNLHLKRSEISSLLESLAGRKHRILEQHEAGVIGKNIMKSSIEDLNNKEKDYRKRLKEIDNQISQNTLSRGYQESLELFSTRYSKMLENIKQNRADIYTIIHKLIEEIIVISRPVNDKDVIAGKKKKNQKVPFRLHIKFKLPQTILQELVVRSENMEFVGAQGFEPWTPSV
jgi:site-specific DNA recombinase